MPNNTIYDPLPLSGSYTLADFCRNATHSGPSNNASSTISKIELLKDKRVAEYWRHEYLVFTITSSSGGSEGSGTLVLYLERGLPDEELSWAQFIKAGFSGEAYDTLEFHDADGEDDSYRRGWSTSVFQITLKPSVSGPLRLRHLAQLLESASYGEKYPLYGLFTANCWSWARGIFFDVIRHPRLAANEILSFKDGSVSALRKDGDNREARTTVMDKEELELFVVTQYGAFGKMLLHFTSDDFRKRYPSVLSQVLVRLIVTTYSIVGHVTTLRRFFHHSSNWTVCLRSIFVGHNQTTNDSGRDLTFTFLAPNFTKLVLWTSAFRSDSIPSSLCEKGKYLYLLTSPIAMSPGSSISSIHVFVFGYIRPGISGDRDLSGESTHEEDENSKMKRDMSRLWLSCAVIRPSLDRTHILHMGATHDLRILPRHTQSDTHYSAICTFKPDHSFVKSIAPGDVIGIWAHSRDELIHVPRIASVKAVARRPFGVLDVLLLVYIIWETQQMVLAGPSLRAFRGFLMCLPYILSVRFEGWIWKILNTFAQKLHHQ